MNAEKIKKAIASKPVKIILVCIAAFALLLAVWKVFFKSDDKNTGDYRATEEEQRLALLLEKIDGVSEATVMISRTEEATSVVVIFDGTDGILTRLQITRVAASALNITDSSVLVYAAS